MLAAWHLLRYTILWSLQAVVNSPSGSTHREETSESVLKDEKPKQGTVGTLFTYHRGGLYLTGIIRVVGRAARVLHRSLNRRVCETAVWVF